MMLTLVTDVTGQTSNNKSPDFIEKNGTSYFFKAGGSSLVNSFVEVVSNTSTQTISIPCFDGLTSIAQWGTLAVVDSNNFYVSAEVSRFPHVENALFHVCNGVVDVNSRLSVQRGGFQDIFVIDGDVYAIADGSNITKIAFDSDFNNPDHTLSGLDMLLLKIDFSTKSFVLMQTFQNLGNYTRDIISELNGNLLIQFATNRNTDTRYYEIDKNNGNIVGFQDFNGLVDLAKDTVTDNIYVAYATYNNSGTVVNRNYIRKFDSNMNFIAESKHFQESFKKIDIRNGKIIISRGANNLALVDDEIDPIEGELVFDSQSLRPLWSPASGPIQRINTHVGTHTPENMIDQVSDDGSSVTYTYSYTGPFVPTLFNGLPIVVNGYTLQAAGNGLYKTFTWVKDITSPADNMTLNNNTDIYSVHNGFALDSNNSLVADEFAATVVYNPAISLETQIGQFMDAGIINVPTGWNSNPRVGMTSAEKAALHNNYDLGVIDTTENGIYYVDVMMYDYSGNYQPNVHAFKRKYYRIFMTVAQDSDGDMIADGIDNCINTPNPNQLDTDNDNIGNICDDDDDNDQVLDVNDVFPFDDTEWADNDNDNIGNNADTDDDNDGYSDEIEIVEGTDPFDENSIPTDMDNDFIPDSTDEDIDGDGALNDQDAFPTDASETADFDQDNIGDNADEDDDNDGYNDDVDAFPFDDTKWEIETAIESVYFNEVGLHPNPVQDLLFVDTEKMIDYVEIYDCLGKKYINKRLL